MNQDLANEKINKWGVLLLIDVPEEMHFGLDNTYWKIGSKFKGVKLIPPGAHFVYYSFKDEKYQFKLSFFIDINERKRIFIKEWKKEIQNFIDLNEEDEKKYTNGIVNFDFDKYLGVYPLEKFETWKEVSKYINQRTLERLYNLHPTLFNMENEYSDNNGEKNEEKTNFSEIEGTINFTNLPTKKNGFGVVGEELTKINFDKSTILKEILKNEYENDYKLFLGEFEVAFITFLIGEMLDSFEQWKKMFILIFSCEELLLEKPEIFLDLIPVVYQQLKQFPKDFFIDAISGNNFMRSVLKNYFDICSGEKVDSKIKARNKKLKEMIKNHFGYDVEEGDIEEEAPVVVDENEFYKI